ncbi:MAG: nucleotidyltransferase [Clostridia bacterium]|nr:nucleotidyltransferase [Clostridia bacterium]
MDTNKTTLAVLAAGMGSRFGGLKQIEPLGPNGQVIIDYSVYDAVEAGFNKAVLIIKKEIEHDFREVIGKRIEKMIDVDYAFQELDKVPSWFTVPEERTKPWGTGHAILCAKDVIDTPFAVINSDDYYGKEAYGLLHDFLVKGTDEFCMAGFQLKNTLTDNGTVSRGVCEVGADGKLSSIVERTKIKDCKYTEDGENWVDLPDDTLVSMNMWGYTTKVFDFLEDGFDKFLKENGTVPKSEYFLPLMVDDVIKTGKTSVSVLPTNSRWYGVTYKEDKDSVVKAFKELTDKGMYKGL